MRNRTVVFNINGEYIDANATVKDEEGRYVVNVSAEEMRYLLETKDALQSCGQKEPNEQSKTFRTNNITN